MEAFRVTPRYVTADRRVTERLTHVTTGSESDNRKRSQPISVAIGLGYRYHQAITVSPRL
jgi:hypothetical protein